MANDGVLRNRRPSQQMLKLLNTLGSRGGWQHGYELMKETGLSSGTLYPLLMRMADKGLVTAEWREPTRPGRPPRHAYRLTAAGVALWRTAAAHAPGGLSLA